jgi:hypothetical protein
MQLSARCSPTLRLTADTSIRPCPALHTVSLAVLPLCHTVKAVSTVSARCWLARASAVTWISLAFAEMVKLDLRRCIARMTSAELPGSACLRPTAAAQAPQPGQTARSRSSRHGLNRRHRPFGTIELSFRTDGGASLPSREAPAADRHLSPVAGGDQARITIGRPPCRPLYPVYCAGTWRIPASAKLRNTPTYPVRRAIRCQPRRTCHPDQTGMHRMRSERRR